MKEAGIFVLTILRLRVIDYTVERDRFIGKERPGKAKGMKILYEDAQMLVCYKEAGLPVQSAGVGTMDLESILKNYLCKQAVKNPSDKETQKPSREPGLAGPARSQEPVKGFCEHSSGQREPYLGVIHRLDQPVEGLVVFAKTPEAAGRLSAQVSAGRMEKTYLAAVRLPRDARLGEGKAPRSIENRSAEEDQNTSKKRKGQGSCQNPWIRLTDDLVKDARSNLSRVVPAGTKGAKRAELAYRILAVRSVPEVLSAGKKTEPFADGRQPAESDAEPGGREALLEIRLLTGRHHQIRVQLAHAGMPILGDRKYGSREDTSRKFPALCAAALKLAHPVTGERMQFQCTPQGADFQGWDLAVRRQ